MTSRDPKAQLHGVTEEPTSWRYRGYLPHFDQRGLVQQVTFRLADSLPQGLTKRMRAELDALPSNAAGFMRTEARLRKELEELLDRGLGSCHLRDPRIADEIRSSFLRFDGERYRLLGWVIMPNHVHALLEVVDPWTISRIVHTWKTWTARAANAFLNRTGRFWQPEYHDRFIRNEMHYARALEYVEGNPVAAGLCRRPEDWRYSSAHGRSL